MSSIPAAGLPGSAVAMLHQDNNDRSTLIIDPERNIVFFGETEHFNQYSPSNNRDLFLQNIVKYMENATRYGSHFTDLLLDGGANAKPAPWDSYWGANAIP